MIVGALAGSRAVFERTTAMEPRDGNFYYFTSIDRENEYLYVNRLFSLNGSVQQWIRLDKALAMDKHCIEDAMLYIWFSHV